MSFPARLEIPDAVLEIARTLEAAGHEAWCVGGALRDALLRNPHADYDFATSARPEEVQRLFRRTAAVGVKHGTVGVIDGHRVLHEVTTFRRDVATDGRHAVVEYGVSLEEDLARRDFTINAIAYHPLRHEWRDPFDGAGDLERRLVRAVGDPAARFAEDYLRILRAIRFAARFGFAVERATWAAAQEAAAGLTRLSAERVREEWFKSLRTAQDIGMLVRLWHEVGAARVWMPELAPEPAGRLVPEASTWERDPVLLTVRLTGDPVAVLQRLKASRAEIQRASAAVTGPASPSAPGDVAARRWLSTVGPGMAEDLIALARLATGREPEWAEAVRTVRDRADPVSRGDLAISGDDIRQLGADGPRVGEILAALLERVLDDPAMNTRERLLGLARELG
ncbi:MAG: CCA tRNA nucleotidyltransferase [Gemmatimonadales bacterium]